MIQVLNQQISYEAPLIRFFLTPEQIRQKAVQALQNVGALPDSPQPVSIDYVVERYAELDYNNMLPKNIHGATFFNKYGKPLIWIQASLADNTSATEETYFRSVLAHETAHAILHNPSYIRYCEENACTGEDSGVCFRIDNLNKQIAKESTNNNGGQKWYEWQAAAFSAALLMPAPLLQEVLISSVDELKKATRIKDTHLPKFFEFKLIERLQHYFLVSRSMAKITAMNLIRENQLAINTALRSKL